MTQNILENLGQFMKTKMRFMTWAIGKNLNNKIQTFFLECTNFGVKRFKDIRGENVHLLSTRTFSSITDQTRLNGSVS